MDELEAMKSSDFGHHEDDCVDVDGDQYGEGDVGGVGGSLAYSDPRASAFQNE